MDEFSFDGPGPVDSDIHIFRMDNEALEVSPVTSRKPYTMSDTALSAVDLDMVLPHRTRSKNPVSWYLQKPMQLEGSFIEMFFNLLQRITN